MTVFRFCTVIPFSFLCFSSAVCRSRASVGKENAGSVENENDIGGWRAAGVLVLNSGIGGKEAGKDDLQFVVFPSLSATVGCNFNSGAHNDADCRTSELLHRGGEI